MTKIRINALPQPKGTEPIKVKKTIQPVEKGDPFNMEIEKGEFVIGNFDHTGFPSTFVAGGSKHYAGGTDINAPENTFVFSNDKTMRIKNKEVVESFGKKEKKTGYTPAKIAKQYDNNSFLKVLADKDTDRLQRETAEDMIKNYNSKLGKLSLAQESMKGFPEGLPFVAMPYLEEMGIDPTTLVHGTGDTATVPTPGEEDVQQSKFGGTLKLKITGVPNKQAGGPSPNKSLAYNEEFVNDLIEKKGPGYLGALPVNFNPVDRGMVDDKQVQVKGSDNIYGKKDWTSAELFPDFRNRNAWYFEQHPEFDPRSAKDVKAFQSAYNEKAKSMGLKPYFSSKPGSKYSLDGKFGEVTFSTPNLDYKPQPVAAPPAYVAPANTSRSLPVLKKPAIQEAPVNQDNPFWTQDLIKMQGAVGDYNRIKKYMPWQAGFETYLPQGNYFDPTRELAANSEQAATQYQALSAFSGPQQLNSRMSAVSGNALANAANILGKYNNMNIAEANQVEQNRTTILNQSSQVRAVQATGLYDKTVATNQNFDNAKAAARNNIRESIVNGLTNRGRTQALNVMNKQYRVDPRTGFVNFTGVPGVIDPAQRTQDISD